MSTTVRLAIESVDYFMRDVRMRLPFRYGSARLVAAPILHTRLRARTEEGRSIEGVSADLLPPKWFDKTVESYRQNIVDLLRAADMGATAYLEAAAAPATPFATWQRAYEETVAQCQAQGLNGLTSSFGSSIVERALLDAAAKAAGCDYHALIRGNRIGLEPGAVHAELEGVALEHAIAAEPLGHLYVRHTVGLSDPIRDADLDEADRPGDGIPAGLEEWARSAQIRYFKVKICADIETDLVRLSAVYAALERSAPADYRISLDGNEQFKTPESLAAWLDAARADARLQGFFDRVIFIEQPMDRAVALTEAGAKSFRSLEHLPPVAIDESDDRLDAFKDAVALGYRGTSVKNCKGVIKGILNKLLVDHYNRERGGGYILTGEDLCNLPVVPLHQDLCQLSVLGIPHAERNGQHYGGTLSHLPEREQSACLDVHSPLYEPWPVGAGRLRIRGGRFDLSSLRRPGFGVGMAVDFDAMTPVADWAFETLGLED